MKDIRCLVGVHDWSTDVPESVRTRTGDVTLVCRRCGRLKSLPAEGRGAWLPSDDSAGGRAGQG